MDLWRGTANQCNVTPKIGEGPSLNPPLIADNVTRERYAPELQMKRFSRLRRRRRQCNSAIDGSANHRSWRPGRRMAWLSFTRSPRSALSSPDSGWA